MKTPRLSIRRTHLIIIVGLNLLILCAAGGHIYHAWEYHGEEDIPAISLFLLSGIMLLSVYSWHMVVDRILRPLDAIINILYHETALQPEDIERTGPDPDEISKLKHVLDILRQNTHQLAQATEDLRGQKNYLQSILETVVDVIIIIDENGLIQMVNPVIKKTLGYSENELLGKNVSLLAPEPHRQNHDHYIRRYLESGQGNIINRLRETEAVRKDGSVIPIELYVTGMKNGASPSFIGMLRDITGRKKVETERERYLHALEISNRELDDFAYIASHDLKEPLRGMQNFSRFLLEDYSDKLDEDGRSKLQTIADLTLRLEELLNALLHYSRLGRTALSIRETDLNEIVRNLLSVFSITMKETNTTIEIPQKLPVVVCDHVRITEVFQNLISNALKYNDKKENKIEIGTLTNHPRKPGETVFYVRDHGIGIPEKHLDSIFKIFKRLHPKDAYGGGTGSGLTIAKKIINQHGGEIWAESRGEGQGTTFFFTIPQKKAA